MVVNSTEVSDKIGNFVKKAVVQAQIEKRLILGLSQVVKYLMDGFADVPTICLIAPPKQGDFATHMQEVLLKAYCFENGIYTLQLDSADKISRILRLPKVESCALIVANSAGDYDSEGSFLDEDYHLTKVEKIIVNYCEEHWDEDEYATVCLPEK